MSYYGWYFGPYVTVAARKRRNADMVQKLMKTGVSVQPVVIEGRTITRTFWGKAWCKNIESYQDYENRLPRGRSYVREGAVLNLQITTGEISAMVAGSGDKPYDIKVKIKTMPEDKWAALRKKCTGKISSLLTLLQGKLPEEILSEFCSQEHGLFPTPREITMECSCPDWSDLCKHLAAVLYAIGARLDKEPKLFFTLRGLNENELIGSEMVETLTEGTVAEIAEEQLADVFGIEFDQIEDVKNIETQPTTKQMAETGAAKQKKTKKTVAKKAVAKKAGARKKSSSKSAARGKPSAGKVISATASKSIWNPSRVKQLRLSLGKTQQQFGELLSVSGALISFLECGRQSASQAVQERLRQLEVSLASNLAVSAAAPQPKASRSPAQKAALSSDVSPLWTAATMRALRHRLKLSQTRLASELLVRQDQVSLMERGQLPLSDFHQQRLTALATAAGESVSDTPLPWDGARIGALRQSLGLTQTDLARQLNVSNALVSQMESGKANVSTATRQKLELLAVGKTD